MSLYAVFSDVHGGAENLEKAFKNAFAAGAEYCLILGDLLNHGPRNGIPENYDPMKIPEIFNRYKHNIIAVKGNCDSEVDQKLCDFPLISPCNILIIDQKKCFMSHGHIFKPSSTSELGLKSGDLFLYGHTHEAVLERNKDGVIILNPGSITFPKKPCIKTMAFIDSDKVYLESLDGEIIKTIER